MSLKWTFLFSISAGTLLLLLCQLEGTASEEMLHLSDPLDCLSQLVCGLNQYPPAPPSARTSTANDYAHMLKNVILRLKKEKLSSGILEFPTSTPIPSIPTRPSFLQDDGSGSQESSEEYTKGSKDQNQDLANINELYPPFGLVEFYAKGNKKGRMRVGRSRNKVVKGKGKKEKTKPTLPPLQLQIDPYDLRYKLFRSSIQCLSTQTRHNQCPFTYPELLLLTSAVLQRQRVVSYSSNRILPMVGYLLKSKSLTQTLKSTFYALEKINNVTLAKDKEEGTVSFRSVFDELIRGEYVSGGSGVVLVQTDNYSGATSHVWEDDELDFLLSNPVKPASVLNKTTPKKNNGTNKKKKTVVEEPQEDSDEGESSEDDETEVLIPPVFGR